MLRKRKGKAAASTSEAPRFKTLYHESHFNKFFAATEVLPESRIKIDDDALSPISAQINLRKWQRLTKPFLTRNEDQFFPESIHRVRKLTNTPLPNAASYHDRKANNNLRLDEVNDANNKPFQSQCGAGSADSCNNHRRNIQVNEIIAEQMYKFVNKTNTRSKLPFPSVIALLCKEAKVTIPGDTLTPQEDPIDGVAMGRMRGPREPRQHQEVEEEAPQQQHQQFQQQQNFPLDFMTSFNNTMATMQQHYDQRWDALQQKFDDAQEKNRRNFGAINQRMNQMDDQLSFLCYSHQLANESMLFPYQNTTRQIQEMEQQGIPITMANLNIHRTREEEMR
ncbi:hypothetical protein PIB30_066723 [Stylosanthes scabra]|uniref:Uncharacterized protein n=1 Tax=Stylosanthes scabra TaxID=79078 RepID=A0ABU6ZL60_9FABA|nr:hypothetical protein [Stylosanthes scabra]